MSTIDDLYTKEMKANLYRREVSLKDIVVIASGSLSYKKDREKKESELSKKE